MILNLTHHDITRYGFLLIPEYSVMSFASAVDQIRMVNYLTGQKLYEWVVLSENEGEVLSSNGLSVHSNLMRQSGHLDTIFVCGGMNIETHGTHGIKLWLKEQSRRKIPIGAMCTGTYILAEAGLLQGYRCTIHWENISGLKEQFPDLLISSDLFEIDKDRYTCAGGSAVMDMMIFLIAKRHGWNIATGVAEKFLIERIRGRNDRQRLPLRLQLGTSQPKLEKAVAFMEANIEESISLDDIAYHVSLSRRQLERLFQKYLNCVPTRYYMRIRLSHARQLLLQTSMPIVDIAFASGFISTPHFSKCYRKFFGLAPRDERNSHLTEITLLNQNN